MCTAYAATRLELLGTRFLYYGAVTPLVKSSPNILLMSPKNLGQVWELGLSLFGSTLVTNSQSYSAVASATKPHQPKDDDIHMTCFTTVPGQRDI